MKAPLAAIVIALGLAGAVQAHAQISPDATTSATAQKALLAALGDKAKDLTVTVSQGAAQLQGWARQPGDVNQARYVVSQLPGIQQATSEQVHTWSSTDRY